VDTGFPQEMRPNINNWRSAITGARLIALSALPISDRYLIGLTIC